MATTNIPPEELEGRTFRYMRTTGAAEDYIPYNIYPQPGNPWLDTGWTAQAGPTPPDTKEAITILEEAEYELKKILKKNPTVKNIETALRDVQKALRALLKIG